MIKKHAAMITVLGEYILFLLIIPLMSFFLIFGDLIMNETIKIIVFDAVIYTYFLACILSFIFLILKIVNIKLKSKKIKKINRVLFWFFIFFLVAIIVGILCAFFGRPLAKIFNPELYEDLEQERLYYLENRR